MGERDELADEQLLNRAWTKRRRGARVCRAGAPYTAATAHAPPREASGACSPMAPAPFWPAYPPGSMRTAKPT